MRGSRTGGALLVVAVFLGGTRHLAAGGAPLPDAPAAAPLPEAAAAVTAEEVLSRWGIRILPVRLSAAGHMVDVRMRVEDADKAGPLFARGLHARLVDETSGRILLVPNLGKVGPLRTSGALRAGRIGWTFFANPGGVIRPGSRVRLELGEFIAAGLVVE